MLKEISIILLSSCCIIYAFQSCKSEAEPQALDSLDIQGRWELVSASVDGKETDRLRSLYFVFLPDTSLQTNIFGSETNFKFSMQSEQIIQFSEPQLTYTILAHTDSTLQVLSLPN